MGFIIDESKGDGRYDLEKFIQVVSAGGVDMYDPLSSVFLKQLSLLEKAGTLLVGADDEYHPEFLSYTIYGTVDYWALLMHYNNKCLFTELKVGTVMNYFRVSDLEDLYFRLKPLKSSGVATTSYGSSPL
ncbi:tail sheath [Pseudomonas phage vB_PpuM-Peetri]